MSTQLSHALARIKVLEDELANNLRHITVERIKVLEVRLEAHNAALEKAAKVCDDMMLNRDPADCAAAIRAMKDKLCQHN
jgi:hypothetical protein